MTTSTIKPTTRLTSAFVRDRGMRPLIVTLSGGIIELRPKGNRTREVVELSALWARAVKERVAFEKRERAKARKEKRK